MGFFRGVAKISNIAICAMGYPKFIASNLKGESIMIQRVKTALNFHLLKWKLTSSLHCSIKSHFSCRSVAL